MINSGSNKKRLTIKLCAVSRSAIFGGGQVKTILQPAMSGSFIYALSAAVGLVSGLGAELW